LTFGRTIFEEFVHLRRAADLITTARGDWRTPGSGYVGVAVDNTETDWKSA
jgi:hypothetical protein